MRLRSLLTEALSAPVHEVRGLYSGDGRQRRDLTHRGVGDRAGPYAFDHFFGESARAHAGYLSVRVGLARPRVQSGFEEMPCPRREVQVLSRVARCHILGRFLEARLGWEAHGFGDGGELVQVRALCGPCARSSWLGAG